jgi:hypothetical protein
MPKPLLLVDVDGPLNPYRGKPTKRPEGYLTHRLTPKNWIGKPLRLWLNPEHGPMLTKFAAENDMELAWATTWEHEANTLIGPRIGLEEHWPVIEFSGDLRVMTLWKFAAVRDYAAGRDLVWFDDDFSLYPEAKDRFLQARTGSRTRLHYVSPAMGLTRADLDEVKNWLRT